jgi:hypothetical protein
MSAEDDVDQLIEQFQQALDEYLKGDPEPAKRFFSHREDVSLEQERISPRSLCGLR